ncbi:MAG: Crp/Fnr family transcriptional regulator [Proteobacteria bacterium]|nr:Crp/Fnr family transcriptional regulator [Pseudomonadota bacterium]
MAASSGASERLSDAQLLTLGAHGITRNFPAQTAVLKEGEKSDALFIVIEGRLKAFVTDASGNEVLLASIRPGEYFGEMVLDGGPRAASVTALEPSRLLTVPRAQFRAFVTKNPAFALSLIDKLIRRVRTLTAHAKGLAQMDVYGRVAKLLLERAIERNGQQLIAPRPTQQEIADHVGASRESVARVLKDLAAGGYISISSEGMVLQRKLPLQW